jgi:hypothetical protein
MASLSKERASPQHGFDAERVLFATLYWSCFALFLAAGAVSRILPRRWRWRVSGQDEHKGIIDSARSAVNNSLPYAFM